MADGGLDDWASEVQPLSSSEDEPADSSPVVPVEGAERASERRGMRQPGHGDLEARLEAFEQETGARAGDNDVAVLDLSNQPAGEAEASPGAEAGANEDNELYALMHDLDDVGNVETAPARSRRKRTTVVEKARRNLYKSQREEKEDEEKFRRERERVVAETAASAAEAEQRAAWEAKKNQQLSLEVEVEATREGGSSGDPTATRVLVKTSRGDTLRELMRRAAEAVSSMWQVESRPTGVFANGRAVTYALGDTLAEMRINVSTQVKVSVMLGPPLAGSGGAAAAATLSTERQTPKVHLKFRTKDGTEWTAGMQPDKGFDKAYSYAAEKLGVPQDKVELQVDGCAVGKRDTPTSLDMEEGDMVDVLVRDSGRKRGRR